MAAMGYFDNTALEMFIAMAHHNQKAGISS